MNNTVVIKPEYNGIGCVAPILNAFNLKIDCQPRSSIIISDMFEQCCDISSAYKSSTLVKRNAILEDLYINVNSMLTCESFMVDSECLYMVVPYSKITFKFNDYEIIILLEKEYLTFSSVIASMYAVWLVFCGHSEKMWLANVLAQPQGSGKPSIEILTKTLQGLYSSKQFNLKDFDIKHIPYIKDVFKNCTYEFLEAHVHLLDKEQIIAIVEELDDGQGERKAMLIQTAGLKDNDKGRFEL